MKNKWDGRSYSVWCVSCGWVDAKNSHEVGFGREQPCPRCGGVVNVSIGKEPPKGTIRVLDERPYGNSR
jgi:predicted RNA-binding Zn-ribbon protein involved in translation (DUF1610 family)